MKFSQIVIIGAVAVGLNINLSFAMERDGGPRLDRTRQVKSEPEIVKWVGEVRDDEGSHTTDHDHELRFTKKDDGEVYNIVDSPSLVKLHHETEKNYLVEIEAEKTAKFLFWGGNLIVKNFKVLADASGPIPHRIPARTSSVTRVTNTRDR